jgi:hypothetical protein
VLRIGGPSGADFDSESAKHQAVNERAAAV